MAKKDDFIMIIAKAFSHQDFSKEEKDLCCDLTMSCLITDYGLNDIQAKEVMNWCAIQHSKSSSSFEKDVLEEGLFDFLSKNKKLMSVKEVKSFINKKSGSNIFPSYMKTLKTIINSFLSSEGLVSKKSRNFNIPSKPKGIQLHSLIKSNLDKSHEFFENLMLNPKQFNSSYFKRKIQESSDLSSGEMSYLNALEDSLGSPSIGSSVDGIRFLGQNFTITELNNAYNYYIDGNQKNNKIEYLVGGLYKVILKDFLKKNKVKRNDVKAKRLESSVRDEIIVLIAKAALEIIEDTMNLFENSDFNKAILRIDSKMMTSKVRNKKRNNKVKLNSRMD